MRLTELELREIAVPMRFSFKHALAERKVARNLIVRVKTDGGTEGWGEVLPRDYLTGETVESARRDVIERWWPAAKKLSLPAAGAPADALLAALEPLYLTADSERKTASYGGLDVAVCDAWCRAAKVSVGSFLKTVAQQTQTKERGAKGKTSTDATAAKPDAAQTLSVVATAENGTPFVWLTAPLGGGSVKTVRRAAVWFRRLGFREFKLKTGIAADLEEDVCRVAAVREAIGPAADLRVDFNAALMPMQAVLAARRFAEYNVSSIEQPIPPGSPTDLAQVQEDGGVPVMADESLCTLDDAKHLLSLHAAKLWNLRVAKVGGFSGMRAMARLAGKHGVQIHLGVLVGETSLMAAAGRACLGLIQPRHVEYGFPRVLLKGDPFRGGPAGYFGKGEFFRETPGLGVRVVEKQLEKVTQWKLTAGA